MAALTAFGICVVNAAMGFIVARWAFGKELNTFLALVFGSFGVRAIVVIVAIYACVGVLGMDQAFFAITFAVSCFVFLMGEILFFHRWFEKLKRQVRPSVTELLKKNVGDVITSSTGIQFA
jgi:predicted membrane channel-forming protein YqfA (hemolysin III family)